MKVTTETPRYQHKWMTGVEPAYTAMCREFRPIEPDEWGTNAGHEWRDDAKCEWCRDRQRSVLDGVQYMVNSLGPERTISVSHDGSRVFVWYWKGAIPWVVEH